MNVCHQDYDWLLCHLNHSIHILRIKIIKIICSIKTYFTDPNIINNKYIQHHPNTFQDNVNLFLNFQW